MTQEPKVTVIIPTYKRSDVLSRAIESVLNQTYSDIEIVVVDDNDPYNDFRKNTELVMERYHDNNKIRYIKHERNKNGSAARNTGIKNSTGKYIAFLDDDDEYQPGKIENCVKRMESLDESWAGCYTAYKNVIKKNHIQTSKGKKEGHLVKEALARNLFLGGGSSIFIRKNVILELNGFDESFQRNQDIEFMVRVFLKYKIAYVDKCSLITHKEIRDIPISYEQSIEIDNKFIEAFKPFINQLSETEKRYVYSNIALQRFRLSIYHKRVFDGLRNLYLNKVGIITTLHYIMYVISRIITKTSYGFNMKI